MNAKQPTTKNAEKKSETAKKNALNESGSKGKVKEQSKEKSVEKKSKAEKKKESKVIPFRYVYHLLLTEKAIDHISTKNTLVFVVDLKARKADIKKEIENIFKVKVKKVNTLIDRKGRKKAYVALMPEYNAEEVATQLGMM